MLGISLHTDSCSSWHRAAPGHKPWSPYSLIHLLYLPPVTRAPHLPLGWPRPSAPLQP